MYRYMNIIRIWYTDAAITLCVKCWLMRVLKHLHKNDANMQLYTAAYNKNTTNITIIITRFVTTS